MTRLITNQEGTEIDFDSAAGLMDDDLREKLHRGDGDPSGSNDRPGSEQQFFDWYCRLHAEKFGEEFEPNKRNPCLVAQTPILETPDDDAALSVWSATASYAPQAGARHRCRAGRGP